MTDKTNIYSGGWIPQIDDKGYSPAEVLYQPGVGNRAYVVHLKPQDNKTFIFGNSTAKLCWQYPYKGVIHEKTFEDFNTAKAWAETVVRLL